MADNSPNSQSCLKVGLVALGTVETYWTETEEFKSAMQSAHEVRQQMYKLVPTHSSACVFEAPAGSYESVCDSCKSLPQNTLERLNRLEGQEGLLLQQAKILRLTAVREAAERVRQREHLDIIVNREAGIVAGLEKFFDKTDRGGSRIRDDFTDEVSQEIKKAQRENGRHGRPPSSDASITGRFTGR